MTIEEILSLPNIEDRIKELKKGRGTDLPDIDTFTKQLDPYQHDVMNPAVRPDKIITEKDEETGVETTTVVKVARSPLAIQDTIVESAVSFLFGSEPKLIPSESDATSKALFDAITRVNKDVKINTINRKVARTAKSFTEVAEYWYFAPVKGEGKTYLRYGFDSKYKLKCKIFDPDNGDTLYPYFDEYGDMVAFSRAFKVKIDGKEVECFEVWTDSLYTRWQKESGSWIEALPEGYVKLNIGKIPISYITVPNEWRKVQPLIDRLEVILSNLGDTNDYFSSPIIFIIGALKSMAKKGEAGKILQGDSDAKAEYLSWDNAPEATKLEVEFLLSQIYGLTSTPDLSTQASKDEGIPASGEAFKMRFLSAHLKVMRDLEYFDSYLTRRVNIQKAMMASIHTDWSKAADLLDIDHVVTPYMIDNTTDTIATIVDAVNGGIMSKKTGVSQNPLIDNAEDELKNIKDEQTSAESLDEQQNEDIDV